MLVGGGHAHVQVIRALNAAARPPNVRVSLIDPQQGTRAVNQGWLAPHATPFEAIEEELVRSGLFLGVPLNSARTPGSFRQQALHSAASVVSQSSVGAREVGCE